MNIPKIPTYDFKWADYVPVLPLTYNDCLSYLETLHKLTEKINEVIISTNQLIQAVLTESKGYTDQKIREQQVYIDNAVNEVKRLKEEIEEENAELLRKIDLKFDEIDAFEADMRSQIASAREYTDRAIESNNSYIINHLAEMMGDIIVRNYFTGNDIPIQDMFNYLAQLHTENSLTYTELANRECDYDTLASYNIDYTTLVLNGGTIIN